MVFLPHSFEILPALHMDFFLINNPIYFSFLENGRNYVSVLITIVGNTSMLVSHSIIFFWYFILISHGVKKKTPPSASPYQVFTRLVCCFTINNSSKFPCSDQIITKESPFLKCKKNYFQLMAGWFWFCYLFMCTFYCIFLHFLIKF